MKKLFLVCLLFTITSIYSQEEPLKPDLELVLPYNGTTYNIGIGGFVNVGPRLTTNNNYKFNGSTAHYFLHYPDDPTGVYHEEEKSIVSASYTLIKAGQYLIYAKAWIYNNANQKYDLSNTNYFYVADINKPASPANFQLNISGGPLSHPTLNWSLNSELDFDYYEIWRKVPQYSNSYILIQTTKTNSFVDLEYYNAPNAGDFFSLL